MMRNPESSEGGGLSGKPGAAEGIIHVSQSEVAKENFYLLTEILPGLDRGKYSAEIRGGNIIVRDGSGAEVFEEKFEKFMELVRFRDDATHVGVFLKDEKWLKEDN